MDAAHRTNDGQLASSRISNTIPSDHERVSTARSIEVLEQAKAAAEKMTTRLLALQRMTTALSDATNPLSVAEIIIDHLANMFAHTCLAVGTTSPDGEHVDWIRDNRTNTEPVERRGKFHISHLAPLTDSIRNKAPIILGSSAEIRRLYPHLPYSDLESSTIIALPFVVDGRAIGGLVIRFSQEQYRNVEDYDFLLHVAHTCTQCFEQARLRDAERLARAEIDTERRHLGLLVEASAVLNASLDASAIMDALGHVIVPHFADFCMFHRRDAHGMPHFENLVHTNPESEAVLRSLVEGFPLMHTHPILDTIRSGKTVFIDSSADVVVRELSVENRRIYTELLETVPIRSIIAAPLVARGENLGTLTFGSSKNRFHEANVLFAEEIAHRTAMALHNARLYHEAQEASRVKDEFLGVVSHELRTPLNAILGWARMLRTGAVREGAQPRALEAIERNASHQARLIDDLLDASRITAGKLRLDATIVELGPVVEAAVQSVLPGATAKGIRLQTICELGALPVFADSSRLQQIIWNLLSNAIKFTPKEGAIDVQVRKDGDEALIRISDNGRGIRADLIPHVFERFRQGDGTLTRNSGGLGLGLSIVRHLVEAHGGTVHAHSLGSDMGATFTVRLPISKPKTITPPKPIPATPKHDTRRLAGLVILVIDDEPDAREILEEVLTLAGSTVKTAADAAEALRILSDTIPDVIISDLAMPGEDGLSLMRKIRARAPDRVSSIPAIALTAYTRTEDRVQALNAGFQLHVPKPVDPTELVATVASLRTLLVT